MKTEENQKTVSIVQQQVLDIQKGLDSNLEVIKEYELNHDLNDCGQLNELALILHHTLVLIGAYGGARQVLAVIEDSQCQP